jgi:lipopolysaccharide/colanic/teichoic acid biosynthesis glycosyltransferase
MLVTAKHTDTHGSAEASTVCGFDRALPTARLLSPKAILEFVMALGLLILVSPLLLVAALLVKLTSRGPVIYSQTRLGLNGRPFSLFKIRTMIHDCESLTGARWSIPGDPRITPIGHWLRRTHLDELPQLWNVLRGEMSLVGPRPERPEFVPGLERAIPPYRLRLLVRPGLTGLAQVQLPADTDLTSVRRKLLYDLYYVRHHGVWLDLRLLVITAIAVFRMPSPWMLRTLRIPGPNRVEGADHPWGGQLPSASHLQAA